MTAPNPNYSSLTEPFVDVKRDFAAQGDGLTDDSAAIASAIAAAATNFGGGTVYFPPGTYLTGTQILQSKVHLRGSGVEATIIQLKPGANVDLLQGQSAPALINLGASYGSGNTGGIYNWSIENLTLDGNKANQTGGPSYCLRVYGYGYILRDLRVRNGYSGGVQSDWNGGASLASPADQMEAQYSNLKIHDNGGIGLDFGGPHDSQWTQMDIMLNAGHGVHLAPNATGLQIENVHVWGCSTGIGAVSWLIEAGGCMFVNCVAEGSDAFNVVVLGNNLAWLGGHIFGPTGMFSSSNGLQLGQSAGNTPYPGMQNQSAGLTTAVQVSGCVCDTNLTNCAGATGAISFNNSGGDNHLKATIFQTSGSAIAGSPSAADNLWIVVQGLTADGTRAKGGLVQFAINANLAVKVTTTGQDVFNVNTFSKRLELPNGSIVRLYSDNYTTRTIELSNGTVNLLQSTTAAALTNGGTITSSGVGIARINPAAAVTGIILQAGTNQGQLVWVINEAAAANSATFAASGSNVADGSGSALAGVTARQFVWDTSTSLWYRAI